MERDEKRGTPQKKVTIQLERIAVAFASPRFCGDTSPNEYFCRLSRPGSCRIDAFFATNGRRHRKDTRRYTRHRRKNPNKPGGQPDLRGTSSLPSRSSALPTEPVKRKKMEAAANTPSCVAHEVLQDDPVNQTSISEASPPFRGDACRKKKRKIVPEKEKERLSRLLKTWPSLVPRLATSRGLWECKISYTLPDPLPRKGVACQTERSR